MDDLVPREPTEASARLAYAADQRIRQAVGKLRGLWVDLAGELHAFKEAELWRDLSYRTFDDWLADPGIELERRYTYGLLAMYQQLVVDRGVEPERLKALHVSKVQEVLPAIRRGLVSLDEGLGDAAELRRADLEARYRGRASDGLTAGPDTSTAVRTEDEPEWRRCGACGSLIQVTTNGASG